MMWLSVTSLRRVRRLAYQSAEVNNEATINYSKKANDSRIYGRFNHPGGKCLDD